VIWCAAWQPSACTAGLSSWAKLAGRLRQQCWAAQVLDEIGIDTSAAIGAAPARRVAAPPQRAPAAAAADEEGTSLTARLAALK
jgi:hypothetical protein